ncbi:MAG TPA: MazG family protein [Acidimicrobiales bacterium]|nr:MazG family protein [Acidimicrobiales bacterium]
MTATTGSPATVVVCGLGPAGPDLVTAGTRDAIARIPQRFVRTTRHPAAPVVGEARSFDHLYDQAGGIDEVYRGIVESLVAAAAEHGEVLYAVPGSPVVAERTVALLAADDRVRVEVVPALSFVDLTWVVLGVDPVAHGVRLVDGHRFASEAAGERGPLLVGQCDSPGVLSEVKLAIGDVIDAGDGAGEEPSVVVLQRLGLPDQAVATLPWHELDRAVVPDHLTSVYVPALAAPVAGEVAAFAEVVRRLRAECPWDREQTHASLRRHLLEEAYEVLEALDHLDVEAAEGYDALEEELGDLLFQIVFHARLAAEEGRFTLADVARGVATKLVGRHPHVFGDAAAGSAEELAAGWEQLKKAEKGRASVMDGIPAALPALLYASKVQKKAASQGVDWRTLVAGAGERLGTTGLRLLEAVDAAREAGDDPETELRIAAELVRDRYRVQESGE